MRQVNVIIPCYQYGRFLEYCVSSVLAQEGVMLRILILDDASTDETEAVGTRLAASDARIEYRRHLVNRGAIATFNEGLAWIEEDHVLLLSADDALVPGALGRAAAILDQRPEVGLVFGRARTFKRDVPRMAPLPIGSRFRVSLHPAPDFLRKVCNTGQNPVPSPSAVVRSRIQREVGDYSAGLPGASDMEMWMRIGASHGVAMLDVDQALYRRHGSNMSVLQFGTEWADFTQRQACFERFFREYRERLPGSDRLEAIAWRRLAEEVYAQSNRQHMLGKAPESSRFGEMSRQLHARFLACWARWLANAPRGGTRSR